MPLPFISLLLKVPSYISPKPHEGLLSFKIAYSALYIFANFNASSAPFINSLVTSSPHLLITLPSIISDGSLGVASPPNCSGHIGIILYPLDMSLCK